ncbi:HCNGP-like protein [Hepatocystis sp. ex Piliocolobus tephrosceles]|nr:HCNGP-like protein [Hepatocystis sp. ex Piliocolobus tephrosceles]
MNLVEYEFSSDDEENEIKLADSINEKKTNKYEDSFHVNKKSKIIKTFSADIDKQNRSTNNDDDHSMCSKKKYDTKTILAKEEEKKEKGKQINNFETAINNCNNNKKNSAYNILTETSYDINEKDYKKTKLETQKENLIIQHNILENVEEAEYHVTKNPNASNMLQPLTYNNKDDKSNDNFDSNINYKNELKKKKSSIGIENSNQENLKNIDKLLCERVENKDNIDKKKSAKDNLKKNNEYCEKNNSNNINNAKFNNIIKMNIDEDNFDDIFKMPENEYSSILNNKITELQKLYEMDLTINKNIINSNEYKNPCILEKIMKVFQIDAYSSNYLESVYNPHDFLSIDLFNENEVAPDKTKTKTRWSTVD